MYLDYIKLYHGKKKKNAITSTLREGQRDVLFKREKANDIIKAS